MFCFSQPGITKIGDKIMTRLFYENLDKSETYNPDLLRQYAWENLWPMVSYLSKAIRALTNITWRVKWESISCTELRQIIEESTGVHLRNVRTSYETTEDKTNSVQMGQDTESNQEKGLVYSDKLQKSGFWVQLIESEKITWTENVINQFFDSDEVYDVSSFRRENKIQIIDRLEIANSILLEREPHREVNKAGQFLYLRPNIINLQRQMWAIRSLQDKPHSSQRSLYRLLENKEEARWGEISPEDPNRWFILKDESIPGTFEQREFVRIALGTPDLAFLEGPPGSGKTITITELILQLIRQGKRVLLCASTHVAVDNVLERLNDRSVLALRVGREHKISQSVKQFQVEIWRNTIAKRIAQTLTKITKPLESQKRLLELTRVEMQSQVEKENSAFFQLILESANVVCGTTIGVIKEKRLFDTMAEGRGDPPFDVMILDEASKTPFTEFLVPAMLAKRWIIVGDVQQLSPYVDTHLVQANIRGLLPDPEDQKVALWTFKTRPLKWHRGSPLLGVINEGEEDFAINLAVQGVLTEKVVCILNDSIRKSAINYLEEYVPEIAENVIKTFRLLPLLSRTNTESWLGLLASDIIIGTKEDFEKWRSLIPYDIGQVIGNINDSKIVGRVHWWMETQDEQRDTKIRDWAYEISWRLDRRHELRFDEKSTQLAEYNKAIDDLLPKFLPEIEQRQLRIHLQRIESIALPSVIELLQYGFDPRYFRQNALNAGLPDEVFKSRHVKLSFQHRMHPDISRFPRKNFYSEISLKDPPYLKKDREWQYDTVIGTKRVVWVDVRGKEEELCNKAEAAEIRKELRSFIEWAKKWGTHPDGRAWNVAVLTFYSAQEQLLRQEIATVFNTRSLEVFKYWIGRKELVRVEVCTVDRFQGHEADYIMLSFVRTKSIGFLDSPNRLNVALTRARYQLMIFGHRRSFQKKYVEARARFLYNLACDKTNVPTQKTYTPRKGRKHS